MSNFLKDMVKTTGNEFASIVEDGIDGGDVTGFVDTGVYALNALLSGSLYGGMPANKIMALAGESATGKTFFALSIVKNPIQMVFACTLTAKPPSPATCFAHATSTRAVWQ